MRVTSWLSKTMLGTALLVAVFCIGCVPPPRDAPDGGSQEIPALTKEVIDERINGARVYDVKPESGNGEPTPWGFDYDEPKEITVVDQQMNGDHATIIL